MSMYFVEFSKFPLSLQATFQDSPVLWSPLVMIEVDSGRLERHWRNLAYRVGVPGSARLDVSGQESCSEGEKVTHSNNPAPFWWSFSRTGILITCLIVEGGIA